MPVPAAERKHTYRQLGASPAICGLRQVTADSGTAGDLSAVTELAAAVAQFIRRQNDVTMLIESLLKRRPRYTANWLCLLTFVTHAGDYLAESANYRFGNKGQGPATLDALWDYLDLQLRRVTDKKPIDPHVATIPDEISREARDFVDFALRAIDSERDDVVRDLDA